jgi:hypothetical protein
MVSSRPTRGIERKEEGRRGGEEEEEEERGGGRRGSEGGEERRKEGTNEGRRDLHGVCVDLWVGLCSIGISAI